MGRFWTIPNIVTLSRVPLILLFAWLMLAGYPVLAVVCLVVAAFTDFLDGYLARKMGEVSDWGVILDQVTDKAAIITIIIVLYIIVGFPAYIFLIFVKDAFTFIFGSYHLLKCRKPPIPNFLGKTTTALQYFTVIFILVYPGMTALMVAVILLLTAAALADYAIQYLKKWKK